MKKDGEKVGSQILGWMYVRGGGGVLKPGKNGYVINGRPPRVYQKECAVSVLDQNACACIHQDSS